jgi:signal transduction histidine kinase
VTLQQVAALVVPALADCCLIYAVQPNGALRPVAATHRDPAATDGLRELAEYVPFDPAAPTGPPAVVRTRRTALYHNVTEALLAAATWDNEHRARLRQLGPHTAIVAPLMTREQVLGVLALLLIQPGRQYGPADMALAEELARRAAVAVDNAQLYQETRAALRARETFLSIASHELRTPVTTLKGHVQRLRREAAQGRLDIEQVMTTVPVLSRNIDRLERLIDDLLDVARLQHGQPQLRLEPTDLVALLQDILMRYAAESGRPTLEATIGPGSLLVLVDIGRLEQVVTNLLDNAVKYSPPDGVIRVTLTTDAAGGHLRVQDAGIGIPPDQCEAIFEPFGRARNAAELRLPGLGLGLYVARLIVERHGGRIWAESAGSGLGATLHVWLPTSAAAV